jgi:glycosyltransferase involved in cell wall biosynthesis
LPREFIESPATDIGTSVRTVLYLGRLAAEKRIDSIIQAAEWLAHIQFRVAGDGPMRAPVERASRRLPNLEYLGWLARDDAMQALDAADILILPSEVEAFGTVALEALARGRVALVSETCGIRQWQSLRPNLFVISADESPAQAIARVTGVSGEALRRRSRQGRDAVRAAVSEALEEWLRVLAGNAPTSQRRDTA